MGHVGGESLDIVHSVAERLAHVRDSTCKKADLIASGGQARYLDFTGAAEPDPMRGQGQPAERPNDGARQEQ